MGSLHTMVDPLDPVLVRPPERGDEPISPTPLEKN
jgi:hypothetical protein